MAPVQHCVAPRLRCAGKLPVGTPVGARARPRTPPPGWLGPPGGWPTAESAVQRLRVPADQALLRSRAAPKRHSSHPMRPRGVGTLQPHRPPAARHRTGVGGAGVDVAKRSCARLSCGSARSESARLASARLARLCPTLCPGAAPLASEILPGAAGAAAQVSPSDGHRANRPPRLGCCSAHSRAHGRMERGALMRSRPTTRKVGGTHGTTLHPGAAQSQLRARLLPTPPSQRPRALSVACL